MLRIQPNIVTWFERRARKMKRVTRKLIPKGK
jgi:hypothetical protein